MSKKFVVKIPASLKKDNNVSRVISQFIADPLCIKHPDGIMSISGWIDLSKESAVVLLKEMKYNQNRNLKTTSLQLMLAENNKGRLFSTNTLGMALDIEGFMALINGNHTRDIMASLHESKTFINNPLYHVVLWIEPSDWDDREHEKLGFVDTMYTRYDAGKAKTIADQMYALGTADDLGINKGELGQLNSAITRIAYRGDKSGAKIRNKTDVIAAVAEMQSPLERHKMCLSYRDHYAAYIKFVNAVPTSSAFGQHLQIKETIKTSPYLSAWLYMRKLHADAGNVENVEMIDNLLSEMVTDMSGNDGRASSSLIQARCNYEQSRFLRLAGSSMQRPLYAVMLYVISEKLKGNHVTIDQLNLLAPGSMTDEYVASGTLVIESGIDGNSYETPIYKKKVKSRKKGVEKIAA